MHTEIKNTSTLCPMPFNSISYSMVGEIGPCTNCSLTNYSSIVKYWNSKEVIQLRTDMINGVRNPACNECYSREDVGAWNTRQSLMEGITDFDWVKVQDPIVEQLWFRFSNLCNYMCIDCNGYTSSSIFKEDIERGLHIKTPIVVYPGNDPNLALSEAKEHVRSLKVIAFSGGEPLLHWQMYDMLNYMIEHNVKPELGYYTNLSKLDNKGQSLTELWNHFDTVSAHVGFDAMGEGCDYFRKKMSFDGTIDNINRVNKESPHVDITVVVTFTWVNAINAVEMIHWFNKNYPNQKITMNFVIHDELNMQRAPESKKKQIDTALKTLYSIKSPQFHLSMVDSLINYLWAIDESAKFPESLKWIKDLDEWRKQDFRIVFPEHQDIKYEDYLK